MAEQVKERDDRDNKDAQESGRPVQLDREEHGTPGHQQGGQHDEPQQDEQGMEHGQKRGQQPAQNP